MVGEDPTEPAVGLFGGLFARGPAAAELTDAAWIRAMLTVEVELVQALADAGNAPAAHAARVRAAAAGLDFDPAVLGRAAADGVGNPVPALVRALVAATDDGTPESREAAGLVHRGATSQDVVDSAAMLLVRRAVDRIAADLARAADRCDTLAVAHRETPVIARTLLQQAQPTTFGLKVGGWLGALDRSRAALEQAAAAHTPLQLGGAVGTLASLGGDALVVRAALARRLELREPDLAWHTDRTGLALVAGALGAVAVAIGKIARDITLLAQTEVGEVREQEDGRGGSSTMPHKRNPVAATLARSCAARAPGLVATLLAVGDHEHERGAGGWHAEWEPLAELLRVVGAAAAWIDASLAALRVDPGRMAANLAATRGLVLAEAVTTALAPAIGRLPAHDLVQRACAAAVSEDVDLRTVLVRTPAIVERIGAAGIDRALDPAAYTGVAGALVDRAHDAHVRWEGRR